MRPLMSERYSTLYQTAQDRHWVSLSSPNTTPSVQEWYSLSDIDLMRIWKSLTLENQIFGPMYLHRYHIF